MKSRFLASELPRYPNLPPGPSNSRRGLAEELRQFLPISAAIRLTNSNGQKARISKQK
ncbi:hypothetical protein ABEB36_007847 [Hypothenemus hampei]|uniref:Uncharacterized protein n=1 Tax=Hypothenemus hampei TaxID=57062 RepID=A0ABD1EVV0_HYPHA